MFSFLFHMLAVSDNKKTCIEIDDVQRLNQLQQPRIGSMSKVEPLSAR
jgi:hypothetical protein